MVQSRPNVLRDALDGPRAAVVATRLAELMGLYVRPAGQRIDRGTVGAVIARAADHGIAEELAARPDAAAPNDETIGDLLDVLRQSPRPANEIRALGVILGSAVVGTMIGVSNASLRRYAGESRETPDAVAQRLHFLTLVVAILRGSYNEFGIRRWFERPHPMLVGEAPAAHLPKSFDPDDSEAQDVLRAASTLLG